MLTYIPTDWKLTDYKCPTCKNNLFSKQEQSGATVWCAQDNSICPNVGANEGAHGKNEKDAYETLVGKFTKRVDKK